MYWFNYEKMKDLIYKYPRDQMLGYVNGHNPFQSKKDIQEVLLNSRDYYCMHEKDRKKLVDEFLLELLAMKDDAIGVWKAQYHELLQTFREAAKLHFLALGFELGDDLILRRKEAALAYFSFTGDFNKLYDRSMKRDHLFHIRLELVYHMRFGFHEVNQFHKDNPYRLGILQNWVYQPGVDRDRFEKEADLVHEQLSELLEKWNRLVSEYQIPFETLLKN